MIDTLWVFASRNLRKHAIRIVATTHPWLSGLAAFGVVFLSGWKVKPYALAGFLLPYDTVVFGFTATAIALAIAIPSSPFIFFLSAKSENSTAFRDFLFVLIWNGLVHIISFLMFLPFIFFETWELNTSGDQITWQHCYVFAMLWLQFYSCAQFLVTTISVFELADLYAQFSSKERGRTADRGNKDASGASSQSD
jgi:hypothetical protein